MKKGIQYSHYLGGDLLEIINSVDLVCDNNLTQIEREVWGKYAKERVNLLRIKISELDKINELKY